MLAYRAAVVALAESFRGGLEGQRSQVTELVDHNENLIALETLAWALEPLPAGVVAPDERQRLFDLAHGMSGDLPPSYEGMTPSAELWWLPTDA